MIGFKVNSLGSRTKGTFLAIRFRVYLSILLASLVTLSLVWVLFPLQQDSIDYWVWRWTDLELVDKNSPLFLYQGDYLLPQQGSEFVKRGVEPSELLGYSEIAVLIRLYDIKDAPNLAGHIEYLRGQWQTRGVSVVEWQLDYDSPSGSLLEYADFVHELNSLLEKSGNSVPLSITGLLTWLTDNPEELAILSESTEYITYQLYSRFDPLPNVKDYFPAIKRLQYPYKIGVTTSEKFNGLSYPKNENYHGKFVFLNLIQ